MRTHSKAIVLDELAVTCSTKQFQNDNFPSNCWGQFFGKTKEVSGGKKAFIT